MRLDHSLAFAPHVGLPDRGEPEWPNVSKSV
jgi:hypothetical protein